MAEERGIKLNLPSKYLPDGKAAAAAATLQNSPAPTTKWLERTWTVTHSTLSMWRSARNVRITYKCLEDKNGRKRIDDLVEYEPTKKTGVRKTVAGVDTEAPSHGWNWRGKGWLGFVTSHWEVLGWGEATLPGGEVERWAITWFAPTIFTSEGLDVYSDRPEGISTETYAKVEEALRNIEAKDIASMVERSMKPVEIKLPWVTK